MQLVKKDLANTQITLFSSVCLYPRVEELTAFWDDFVLLRFQPAPSVPIAKQRQFGSRLSLLNTASRMGRPGAAAESQGLVESPYLGIISLRQDSLHLLTE